MNQGHHAVSREILSRLMDGEASALETESVLQAIILDPELRAAWRRYQLIGAVLRGDRLMDLEDRSIQIRAAIQAADRAVDAAETAVAAGMPEALVPPSLPTLPGKRDGADGAIVREALSCLVDGEASEMETRRVLKTIATDPGVRETWRRYQTISAVMRGDNTIAPVDLSTRIRAAIDAVDGDAARAAAPAGGAASPLLKRILLPLGRAAIAASVAAVALLAFQQMQFGNPTSTARLADAADAADARGPATEEQAPHLTHPPQVGVRVASMDSSPLPQAPDITDHATMMGSLTQEQIQAYLNLLIARHQASVGGDKAYSANR